MVAQQDDDSSSNGNKRYRGLVIDSGPIIKLAGVSELRNKADQFYSVPAVLTEIRDAKARQHLQNLPFAIQTREPTSNSIQAVTEFARLTGDYQSLSKVDILVLALVYELEKEGCQGSIEHIRTKPKRTVGVGKVELLNPTNNSTNDNDAAKQQNTGEEKHDADDEEANIDYDIIVVEDDEEYEEEEEEKENEASFFETKPVTQPQQQQQQQTAAAAAAAGPAKSWALLVNPLIASKQLPTTTTVPPPPGRLDLLANNNNKNSTTDDCQFSDPEEEKEEQNEEKEENYDDDEKVAVNSKEEEIVNVEEELQKEFPSLAASLHVPFEGEDYEIEENKQKQSEDVSAVEIPEEEKKKEKEDEEQRKKDSLKPLSKSGKTYNSFRRYGKLFKPGPASPPPPKGRTIDNKTTCQSEQSVVPVDHQEEKKTKALSMVESRIIGGLTMSGQEVDDIEDDGEGWVTCTRDIRSLQAAGTLAPPKNDSDRDDSNNNKKQGPALDQRTACATTDFAMQNVILQMNLELLSVDGVKIRKLKNWVTRCGACFKVYTKNEDAGPHGMKRLFCERCGSDMLQRIAASVDAKTGRLRLHMSKKYKNSTRGTKYSLPKPNTGNRFQGDLLLREDQLLMGAWNQKVKIRSGGKAKSAAQSMFGQDIAANVGCKAKSMNVDDIAAGFGRRNPNSSKGGRERRGKKKKSKDKACGLRRYH